MKKRYLVLGIIILLVGYFVHSCVGEKMERDAKIAEMEKKRLETKSKIDNIVNSTNAVSDWEEKLSQGQQYRMSQILTIELEELWASKRPILFIGKIKDIAKNDQRNCILKIERSLFSNIEYLYKTDLELELNCSVENISRFISDNPNFQNEMGLPKLVAVIANVYSIKTSFNVDSEGSKGETKIGVGDCIDIIYVGDTY